MHIGSMDGKCCVEDGIRVVQSRTCKGCKDKVKKLEYITKIWLQGRYVACLTYSVSLIAEHAVDATSRQCMIFISGSCCPCVIDYIMFIDSKMFKGGRSGGRSSMKGGKTRVKIITHKGELLV